MSWWNWQSRLLPYAIRYGLLKSGFLDEETAKDLANFDISLGSRKSAIELKNVGLSVSRVSGFANLPPSLRIETARILLLRFIIVREGYQPNIELQIEGIEVVLRLEEDATNTYKHGDTSTRTARAPQHRKSNRRLRSPPPYDPGGLSSARDGIHIPTTEEMASSFVQHEPLRSRKEMEASVAADLKSIDESVMSESSESDDVGTGVAGELPRFISSILEGVLDRAKFTAKDVNVFLKTDIRGESSPSIPLVWRLGLGTLEGESFQNPQIKFRDISVDLISKGMDLSELSEMPLQTSPPFSRSHIETSAMSTTSSSSANALAQISPIASSSAKPHIRKNSQSSEPSTTLEQSELLQDSISRLDRLNLGAMPNYDENESSVEDSSLEIRPGDDNISWTSRRSQTDGPPDDLWKSMVSEDDLPQSLFLSRTNAPPTVSSRGSSPLATRTQRSNSPISQRLRNANSWPVPDDFSAWARSQQSPGSWPNLEAHQQFEQERPHVQVMSEESTDNKAKALELNEARNNRLSSEQGNEFEEMAQSRLFSHEDAESMYMSAMSGMADRGIPGGWKSDYSSDQSMSPDSARATNEKGKLRESREMPEVGGQQEVNPAESGNVTPRGRSLSIVTAEPSVPTSSPDRPARLILSVDVITFAFRPANIASKIQDNFSTPSNTSNPSKSDRTFRGQSVPGAFSIYSDISRSQRNTSASECVEPESVHWAPQNSEAMLDSVPSLVIAIGSIEISLDPAVGRCLYTIGLKAQALSSPSDSPDAIGTPSTRSQITPRPDIRVTARAQGLSFSFRNQYLRRSKPENTEFEHDPPPFSIASHDIELLIASDTNVRIGHLSAKISGKEVLAFRDDDANVASSTRSAEGEPEIHLSISHGHVAATGRPVINVFLATAPIHFYLDLKTIDNTFSPFGGLSGMLEIGSTVLSDGGSSSPVSASKAAKGVRFIGDSNAPVTTPELKVNGRISGIRINLVAPSCKLTLRTTAMKIVHRESGTSVAIDHVIFSGPHADPQQAAPLCVDIAAIRIDFLVAPQDKDLERLLSLLTPSKDKYDRDDDILIDTLLRQRRKGAVLRAHISEVKLRIDDWKCLESFTALSDDMTKLAAVAKYLPEDDRPGLLTLLRVKATEAQFPVNDRFGLLRMFLRDVHIAHVGLPALMALSIDDLSARSAEGPDLIHPLVPLSGSENLPAVMARMLGNEEEPVIKVKLFNVCVEYSVDILTSLTNLDQYVDTEQAVADIAKSLVDLAVTSDTKGNFARASSDVSKMATKMTTISLLVHDSAIGLTPQRLPSKALFVLNDAHFATKVPPGDATNARLELRKAAIFIIDSWMESPAEALPAEITSISQRLSTMLMRKGYASVCSIRSAIVDINVANDDSMEKSNMIEVMFQNELFLVETCADSTATLLATLAGLAPPTQPSKDPKYLVQPMTIEDMMASFTGAEVEKPMDLPETLFDQDEEHTEDSEMLFDALGSDQENQDLFAESEMNSSLYGPVSGIFDMEDDADEARSHQQDHSETVASLLDEDPFEMTEVPADTMSDAPLLRELDRQRLRSVSDDPVSLQEFEDIDFGFDALSRHRSDLGHGQEIGHPTYGESRQGRKISSHGDVAFRLKLRECHLIWHLYDGYDWQRTRDGIIETVERVEAKAEERRARRRQSLNDREEDESVIGDFLFNSIYIGVPAGHDAQELRRAINRNIDDRASESESVPISGISRPTSFSASGQPRHQNRRRRLRLGRSAHHKIAFELSGVSADVLTFVPGSGDVVSSISLRLKDFEIFDNVPSSTWRKFLTHVSNDPHTRELSKPMFDIDVRNIKTLESHSASEMALHVTALPLRLHVDQDALDFITRFFAFKDPAADSTDSPSEEPFIQRLEVDTIDLWLDYKPKHIDYIGLRSGKTTEFMNFIGLDASHIRLKHAIVYGLRGFDKIHPTLNDIWMNDVRRNQLPTVIAGLAPVRSLVNLGTGIRDVVAIPVREYRKDGRLVRSIQKGAYQFGRTTAAELARLGAKVALGTQTALTSAEQMLTPPPHISRPGMARRVSSDQGWQDAASGDDELDQRAVSAYANQPLGVLAGLKSARRHLEHDLLTARDALIAVQGEVMESSGPGGAAAAVARHAPTMLLRPVIGATRAMGTTLLGVGNQIDRGNLRKLENKYKPR